MTTELERILKQGRNKLPDISAFHYAQTTATEGFNENAVTQSNNYDAYQQAVIQQIAASKSDLATDVTNLINAVNKVGLARERNFEREVKRDFRKNFSKGSDYVTRVPELTGKVDKTESKDESDSRQPFTTGVNLNEAIIERNTIEKDINEVIDTSPRFDPDAIELKKPNPLKKVVRSNADIANTGFRLSLTAYAEMKNKKMYKVESKDFTGVTSFEEAKRQGWKMDDGSSMAEHIRREIFSDIFFETGLNNVGSLHLKRYYFEPLAKWLEKTQINEAIEYVTEIDENYKAERQAELITGLSGNAGAFLSGSQEDGGSSGYFFKNGQTLAGSADKLLAELQELDEAGKLKSSVLNNIIGGDYYVKGEKKPLSFREWSKKDKRLEKLYDWVTDKANTIGAQEVNNRNLADINFFKSYTERAVEDIYNTYGPNLEGYTEEQKTEDINKHLAFLKSDKSGLSVHLRKTLTPEDLINYSLMNSIPTEQILSDLEIQIKAEQALQNPDTAIGQKNYEDMMSRIKDRDKLNTFRRAQVLAKLNGTTTAESFKSGQTDAHAEIDKIVDAHTKSEGSPLGPLIKARAKARFDQIYLTSLLTTGNKEQALKLALTEIDSLIKNNKFSYDVRSALDTTTQKKILATLEETKDYIDNVIGGENILTHDQFLPGEVSALNLYTNTGNIYYYQQLTQSYFPNEFTHDIILRRMEVLNKRKFEPWEIEAYKNDTNGFDLTTMPFMDDKKFNATKLRIMKAVEAQSKSLSKTYPEVANLAFVASDTYTAEDAFRVFHNKKLLNTLTENSGAGEIFNYMVKTGFAVEPIFEALYNKKALKGKQFNHFTKNGVDWSGKLDKDLNSTSVTDVVKLLRDDTSTGSKFKMGIFGITPDELMSYLESEQLTGEEGESILFNEEFQGKVMFHKIKTIISKNNNLSSITANKFRRLSKLPKQKREAFIKAVKKGTIVSDLGIEDQYATINTPGPTIVTSIWHDPQFLSTPLLDYLKSADYLELDLTSSSPVTNQTLGEAPTNKANTLPFYTTPEGEIVPLIPQA